MSEIERWAAIVILSFVWLNLVRVAVWFAVDAFRAKSPLLPMHIAMRLGVFGGFLAVAGCAWYLWQAAPDELFGPRMAQLGLLAWVIVASYGLFVWAFGCGVTYGCCFRVLVWVWRRRTGC